MKSIYGVRYLAAARPRPGEVRRYESFPFGSLEDLKDLAGGEPVEVIRATTGSAHAHSLLLAFRTELHSGPGGGVDMEAFGYFATTLVPSVDRLATAAGGGGDRVAYELTEKLVALADAGVPMREALAKAMNASVMSAEQLSRWALERDLAGAVYLEGLLRSINYRTFAEALVQAGLAGHGTSEGV